MGNQYSSVQVMICGTITRSVRCLFLIKPFQCEPMLLATKIILKVRSDNDESLACHFSLFSELS